MEETTRDYLRDEYQLAPSEGYILQDGGKLAEYENEQGMS